MQPANRSSSRAFCANGPREEGRGNARGPGEPVEERKSKSRIPTFPRLIHLSQTSKPKGDQSRPANLVFRLISGLENAKEAGALVRELVEVRVTAGLGIGKVRIGADGYGEHDDLVIALALACWRARRRENGFGGQ